MSEFSPVDLFAVASFLLCWIGYTFYSGRRGSEPDNLIGAMAAQRQAWMRQMLGRDNRMLDIQIMRNLTRTGTFFASTSMLILAGLATILGATDKAIGLFADLPLLPQLSPLQWELRLLALILIFIYAFFKFAWSIRQLSYCTIQIGAMEPADAVDDGSLARCKSIADLITLAAVHSNRGLRAFYFAIAFLEWFIHPLALIVASFWVVLVLYRREFHSRTLALVSLPE